MNTVDFQTLFEALPGNHLVVQPHSSGYTVVAISDALLHCIDKDRKEIVGKNLGQLFSENKGTAEQEPLHTSLQKVVQHKSIEQIDTLRLALTGRKDDVYDHCWSATIKPINGQDNDLTYILVTLENATNKATKKEHTTDRTIIEQAYQFFIQAPVAICIVKGSDYTVEMVNDRMLQLLGRTAAVINKPIVTTLPEAVQQGLIHILDAVRKTKKPYNAPGFPASLLINGIKEQRYFDLVFQPFFDHPDDREAHHIFCIAHDITEQVLARKNAEEIKDRLNFRNALFEAQNEVTPDGILIVDVNGKILLHNKRFAEIWKMPQAIIDSQDDAAALQHAVTQLINPETFIAQIKKLYDQHDRPSFEQLYFKDGRVIERHGAPIVASDGTYYGWAWYFRDSTSRIQQEQKFRNVVEQATDMIAIFRGEDLEIEIANDALLKIWQADASVINQPFTRVLPEMEEQGFADLLKEVLHTGEPVYGYEAPAVFKRKNGKEETVYFNFRFQPYHEVDGSITGVLVVATDVTQQVTTRQELKESEARFRLLADAMPQLIWTGDAEGRLNYFNQAVYQFSGLSYEEIKEDGWLQIVHPEEREENVKIWMHSIATGEDFIFNHRFKNKEGQYRWQLSRAIPQRDSEGNIQLWIGTSTDIHEHKLFEEELNRQVKERTMALENKNRELERSNANLEEFAHAASHDLKEPIRKIQFFTDRLKGQLADRLIEDEQQTFIRIENASQRMGALVDDLLLYSHVSHRPHEKEAVDLNEKLAKVMEDLELDIQQKGAEITIGPLPVIMGYRRQLQQLFQNLLTNALKYHKKGVPPQVHITSSMVSGKEIGVPLTEEEMEKPYHLIQVQDNGIGFEQDETEKIFQMFQRLHGVNEYTGTGVGLSIVRKVVENHGGKLLAEGKPGIGATFYVYLPAIDTVE